MSYNELPKDEDEILSAEDKKLCTMLGNLKRVSAPKNFDFHLKAKIANSKAEDFRTKSFFPILRYVLPLGLVLLLSTFIVLNSMNSADNLAALPLTETSAPILPTGEKTENKISGQQELAIAKPLINQNLNAENSILAAASPKINSGNKKAISTQTKESDDNAIYSRDFGGDRLETLKNTKIIAPRNINPIGNSSIPQNSPRANSISVRAVLTQIGVDAQFINSNWKVKSIAVNSLANRAGLRIGDIIESADDVRLSSENLSTQKLSIKSLQILRDNQKIILQLP